MITPLADRVLCRRVEAEEITRGGIAIPDTYKEKPIEAIVLAVGEGKVSDDGRVFPLSVKVGDRVLIARYGGTDVDIDGEELLILVESEVLAIVARVAKEDASAVYAELRNA